MSHGVLGTIQRTLSEGIVFITPDNGAVMDYYDQLLEQKNFHKWVRYMGITYSTDDEPALLVVVYKDRQIMDVINGLLKPSEIDERSVHGVWPED